MDPLVQLDAQNSSLQLTIGANDWCRCTLVQGTEHVYLGAESPAYVAQRLLEALGQGQNLPQVSNDTHLRWVLSLAEVHATLYLKKDESQKELDLIWQDKTANIIGHMHLSQEQTAQWIIRLRHLVNRNYG